MSLPSPNETAIKRLRWLLLLPPCLPGMLFLLLWWMQIPTRPGVNAPPELLVAYAVAGQRAAALYTAGSIALLGGALMAAFIAWKILCPPPPDEDEGDDEPDA